MNWKRAHFCAAHLLWIGATGLVASGCKRGEEESPSVRVEGATAEFPYPSTRSERFRLAISTVTDAGAGPLATMIRLEGGLDVLGKKTGETLLFEARLVEPKLLDHAGRPLDRADSLLRELSRPFGFALEKGKLVAHFDPSDTGRDSAGFRATIASLFQSVTSSGKTSWTTAEWDATGLGTVEWKTLGEGRVGYRKIGYEKLVFGTSNQLRSADIDVSRLLPTIADSSGEARYDGRGIVSWKRHDDISVPLSQGRRLRNVTDTTLDREETPGLWTWADGVVAAARRRAVDEPPKSRSVFDFGEPPPEGTTYEELMKVLGVGPEVGSEGSAKVRGPAFRGLVAFFRNKPETIENALSSLPKSSKDAEPVIDALGVASTAESFAALERIVFSKQYSNVLRQRAALAAIRAEQPGERGFELIEKLVESKTFGQFGTLGLGTFVRRYRESGEETLEKRGTTLLRKLLAEASNSQSKTDVLLGIANSGAPQLFENVVRFQSDSVPGVRDAAIQALRLMPSDEVDRVLEGLLVREEPADLVSTLHALEFRKLPRSEIVSLVTKLAETHAVPDVRRAALLALRAWQDERPDLREVISRIRDKDESKMVRDALGSVQ